MHGYIEVTTTNRKSETSEAKKRKQCKEGAQMLCYQEKLNIPLVSSQMREEHGIFEPSRIIVA
jgi:hypothetical protein